MGISGAFVSGIALSSALPCSSRSVCRRRPFRSQTISPLRYSTRIRMDANHDSTEIERSDSRTMSSGFALADAAIIPFAVLTGTGAQSWARAGAYAVRDARGELQYIGYSKDVCAKLVFHASLLPERCFTFQAYIPDVAAAEVTADMLEQVLEYWVRENGAVPPGNLRDRALWEGTSTVPRQSATRRNASAASPQQSFRNVQIDLEDDIPVRPRRAPRREPRASRGRADTEPRRTQAWTAEENDFVELEVDPLDPFTATSHRKGTRMRWDDDDDDDADDWIPLFGLAGVAALIWLFSVLGNTVPASAPSLGM